MTEYLKTTIVFPLKDDEVVLGMKKRGFGEGWWNGFGGKLEGYEDYEQNAKRETMEEVGLKISNLILVANLHFYFDGVLKVVSKAFVADFSGKPKETDEMRPQIFKVCELPFKKMWPADELWIPKALSSKNSEVLGFVIYFGEDKSFESLKEVSAQSLEPVF